MRIAILTLPLHTNYGGILQAYALQTVLERMGHKVTVIGASHFTTPPKGISALGIYSWRIVKRLFGQVGVLREIRENEKYAFYSSNTENFINTYINRREIESFSEIKQGEYDGFVVGSDQIWSPICFEDLFNGCGFENAFLKFSENWEIKRIAYGVSGLEGWEFSDEETIEYSALLMKFNAVSVREKSSIGILNKKFNYNNAIHVLDPVLLLKKIDYTKFVKHPNSQRKTKCLMYYILDNTEAKMRLVERVSIDYGLTPFTVNYNKEERKMSSVESWIEGFVNAEFIITDSFHGCVFSILFDKPFIVIGNCLRGLSRFESLLSTLSLEKNMIMHIDEYKSTNNYNIGQYTKSMIESERTVSLSFLYNSLSL